MTDRPWAKVLDEVYQMGGAAEYPIEDTDSPLNTDEDLSQRLSMDEEAIRDAVSTLCKRRLSTSSTLGIGDEGPKREDITLKSDGFKLAHDRDQAKRDRASNKAIILLTMILAIVGLAQATALSASSSYYITGGVVTAVWVLAVVTFLITYFDMFRKGALDFEELKP